MAEKKEKTQQEQTQQEQQGEKMVKIILPKDELLNKGNLFVSVGMKEYILPRGKMVEVPESVAEVISNSLKQEDESMRNNEIYANVHYNG